jgi:hypothetical protein
LGDSPEKFDITFESAVPSDKKSLKIRVKRVKKHFKPKLTFFDYYRKNSNYLDDEVIPYAEGFVLFDAFRDKLEERRPENNDYDLDILR